jgi:hypothetical protein
LQIEKQKQKGQLQKAAAQQIETLPANPWSIENSRHQIPL